MRSMAEPLQPSMRVVILHGKDGFTILERLKRFQRALTDAHGEVSRFDFDGATARVVDVIDELRTFGLLATHKLIVVDKADQFVAGEEARRAHHSDATASSGGSHFSTVPTFATSLSRLPGRHDSARRTSVASCMGLSA